MLFPPAVLAMRVGEVSCSTSCSYDMQQDRVFPSIVYYSLILTTCLFIESMPLFFTLLLKVQLDFSKG